MTWGTPLGTPWVHPSICTQFLLGDVLPFQHPFYWYARRGSRRPCSRYRQSVDGAGIESIERTIMTEDRLLAEIEHPATDRRQPGEGDADLPGVYPDLTSEQLEGMGMWDRDPGVFRDGPRAIWAIVSLTSHDLAPARPREETTVSDSIEELRGTVAHLRSALTMLHREAARDWLDHVHSDAALDALEYARRTLRATDAADAGPPGR